MVDPNHADSPARATGGPILVPVDFSPHSEAAVVWAAGVAAALQSSLVILHVIHDPAHAPGSYHEESSTSVQRFEGRARPMLDAFLEEVRLKHPDLAALQTARCRLVSGLPVTRILEVAREQRARLIVIGSRGLTGLPHLLLGSTAERVIQLAPIPVTVVKAPSSSERDRE